MGHTVLSDEQPFCITSHHVERLDGRGCLPSPFSRPSLTFPPQSPYSAPAEPSPSPHDTDAHIASCPLLLSHTPGILSIYPSPPPHITSTQDVAVEETSVESEFGRHPREQSAIKRSPWVRSKAGQGNGDAVKDDGMGAKSGKRTFWGITADDLMD